MTEEWGTDLRADSALYMYPSLLSEFVITDKVQDEVSRDTSPQT